jgi:hypothetical protein
VIEPKEDITAAKKIGEEITEVLEYTPGKLYVTKYVRSKYVMPSKLLPILRTTLGLFLIDLNHYYDDVKQC